MIIPEDKDKRVAWALRTISDCAISQTRRIVSYEDRARWYMYGDSSGIAEVNKIMSSLDTLSAYLFTGETVSFTFDLDEGANPQDVSRALSFERQINKIWHDTNLDSLFSEKVSRALTFGSMFLKLVPGKNNISAYLCEPGSMGVLREDTPGLDRQEAFTHRYWVTLTELYKRIGHTSSGIDAIKRMRTSSDRGQKQDAGPIRAWATAVPQSDSGTLTGNVSSVESPDEYLPEVRVPMVRVTELYVKDDKMLEDWRLITIADPDVVIYDGPCTFLPGEHGFVQLSPMPLYSYFWGMSFVSFMRKMQDWSNDEIWNIRNLMNQQFDPPKAFMGWDMMDEAAYALGEAGASVAVRNPNAKVQDFRPPMPPDIWAVQNGIDRQLADLTGLSEVLQGKGKGHDRSTDILAQLGSVRLKKMSSVVEDSLDQIATKLYKCIRAYWTDKFHAEHDDGSDDAYMPSEFIDDAVVHVDGHSQSAIFNAQMKQDAELLIKNNAIDRHTYIEMLNPPNKAVLLRRLKKIEQNEAQQSQIETQLKKMKIENTRR